LNFWNSRERSEGGIPSAPVLAVSACSFVRRHFK
jgi:hypothetical protein